MPELVPIDDATFAEATALALKTLSVFQQNRGHYNNNMNSHLRGKLGEIACARWVETLGLDCEETFRDLGRMAETDLVIHGDRGCRIDVKTWSDKYWPELGRCVAVNQLAKLQAKSDLIIWCITPEELRSGIRVQLVGWNSLEDIANAPRRLTGPPRGRKVDNFQVDSDCVRNLAELSASLGQQEPPR